MLKMSELSFPSIKRTITIYLEDCLSGIIPPCMPNNFKKFNQYKWDGKAFLDWRNAYVWDFKKNEFDIIPLNFYNPENYIKDERLKIGEYSYKILSNLDSCKKDTTFFSFNDPLFNKKVNDWKIACKNLKSCNYNLYNLLNYDINLKELIDN